MAFIDGTKRAARTLTLAIKRRVWLPPSLGYYDDTDKTCRQCGVELSGRRTRFCSKECANLHGSLRDWRGLRLLAFRRDKWTCQRCGERFWPKWKGLIEGDHIIEIVDGGEEFDLNNVQTLCVLCHKAKTKEGRQKRGNIKTGNR